MKRLPFLTATLVACALLAHASPALSTALQFDRDALPCGELWRLLTGHLTHFNPDHLRWDLAVFVALGATVEFHSRRAFVICAAASALAISLAVWALQPQFAIYRGLSGIDSALFALVAASLIRTALRPRQRDWPLAAVGAAALAGFLAKSAWELHTGSTFFVAPTGAFAPAPLAHLIGLAVGTTVAFRAKPTPARTVQPRRAATALDAPPRRRSIAPPLSRSPSTSGNFRDASINPVHSARH